MLTANPIGRAETAPTPIAAPVAMTPKFRSGARIPRRLMNWQFNQQVAANAATAGSQASAISTRSAASGTAAPAAKRMPTSKGLASPPIARVPSNGRKRDSPPWQPRRDCRSRDTLTATRAPTGSPLRSRPESQPQRRLDGGERIDAEQRFQWPARSSVEAPVRQVDAPDD